MASEKQLVTAFDLYLTSDTFLGGDRYQLRSFDSSDSLASFHIPYCVDSDRAIDSTVRESLSFVDYFVENGATYAHRIQEWADRLDEMRSQYLFGSLDQDFNNYQNFIHTKLLLNLNDFSDQAKTLSLYFQNQVANLISIPRLIESHLGDLHKTALASQYASDVPQWVRSRFRNIESFLSDSTSEAIERLSRI